MSDDRIDRVEVRFDGLETRFDRLETRLDKVEVTLEEMRDNVKQVAEGHFAIFSAVQRGFQQLDEKIDRRLEPIEAAVLRGRS